MFPRHFYAGRFFAPRYFPQSQGGTPVAPTGLIRRLLLLGVGE